MIATPLSLAILVYPFYILLGLHVFQHRTPSIYSRIRVLFFVEWPIRSCLIRALPYKRKVHSCGVRVQLRCGNIRGLLAAYSDLPHQRLTQQLAPVIWLEPLLVVTLATVAFYRETKGIDLDSIPEKVAVSGG